MTSPWSRFQTRVRDTLFRAGKHLAVRWRAFASEFTVHARARQLLGNISVLVEENRHDDGSPLLMEVREVVKRSGCKDEFELGLVVIALQELVDRETVRCFDPNNEVVNVLVDWERQVQALDDALIPHPEEVDFWNLRVVSSTPYPAWSR